MALPSSGPLKFTDLLNEFEDTEDIRFSDYYRGGALVPNAPANNQIATSGALRVSDFYGATNEIVVTISNTREIVSARSLFNSIDWLTAVPKRIIIEATAILGSRNSSQAVFTVENDFDGPLAIENYGQILGAGGDNNGGADTQATLNGGPAMLVQKAISLLNDGQIYGGGGAGSDGGASGSTNKCCANGCCGTQQVQCGNRTCCGNGCTPPCPGGCGCLVGTSFVCGPSAGCPQGVCGLFCDCRRNQNINCCNGCCGVNAGAVGGEGGQGQGYLQSQTGGISGTTGVSGNRSGDGGGGGTWGQSGVRGGTGQAGSGAVAPGAAGAAISGYSLVTVDGPIGDTLGSLA